jgi:hypothetical protein
MHVKSWWGVAPQKPMRASQDWKWVNFPAGKEIAASSHAEVMPDRCDQCPIHQDMLGLYLACSYKNGDDGKAEAAPLFQFQSVGHACAKGRSSATPVYFSFPPKAPRAIAGFCRPFATAARRMGDGR